MLRVEVYVFVLFFCFIDGHDCVAIALLTFAYVCNMCACALFNYAYETEKKTTANSRGRCEACAHSAFIQHHNIAYCARTKYLLLLIFMNVTK